MSSNNSSTAPFGQADASAPDHMYTRFLREYENVISGKLDHNKNVTNLALFGIGRIGTIHVSILSRNRRANIAYLIDIDITRAEAMKQNFKLENTIVLSSEDYKKALEDSSVDAVVVCTPSNNHEQFVLAALNHGKAVLCEKPLALDMQGALQCRDLAKKKKLPLLCAFNRRYDPTFNNIKKRVDKGDIGPVHVIKSCSRDSPIPSMDYLKISGGIFHDCLVHDIDLICWVLNEKPNKVFAMAHAHRQQIAQIGDVDTVAALLYFPSGAIGSIDISRHATYGYDQRLETFGSKGQLATTAQNPIGVEAQGPEGTMSSTQYYSFSSRYADAYSNQMDHFIDVVQDKVKPRVTADDAIAASRITEACHIAYKTGKMQQLQWDD